MSDQCKQCDLRGDYDKCIITECFRHESWIDIQRIEKINKLQAEVKKLKEDKEQYRKSTLMCAQEGLAMCDEINAFKESTRWRKVSKELPDDHDKGSCYIDDLLVKCGYGVIEASYFKGVFSEHMYGDIKDVTRWMPMPEFKEDEG